eukprot:3179675-Prymnesium_polylepis.1
MHDDLDGYTPPDDLAAGRCCRAQDVGVLAAGVLIGGARYARDVAHERLSAHPCWLIGACASCRMCRP